MDTRELLRTAGEALLILGIVIAVARFIWPNHLGAGRTVYRVPLFLGLILLLIAAMAPS